MTKSIPKIALSASRDIPLDKLVMSPANVRKIRPDIEVADLAEDVANRTLLQGLVVRPVLDEAGSETGFYEVPAGGRRLQALQLLAAQKRLAKNAPVPCIVRTEGLAEEDSLAENVQRAPLHPLDQFRAFLTLREKGRSEAEIAAAFFVTPALVKQRLKLASVSPKLLDVFAADAMTLDQLAAFTVCGDHARQEQVFDRLTQSYAKDAHTIRRMLTEEAIRASDKRARFVGPELYQAEGGTIMRDLFTADDDGWFQNPGLVDRLVAAKLDEAAEAVRAEGWKWIEVGVDLPYDHTYRLRQLRGEPVPLTPEQDAERAELQAEYDRIEAEHADAEELTDDADQRLGELELELEAYENLPTELDPAEVARAGAFVSLAPNGTLKIERGYIRPSDEASVDAGTDAAGPGGTSAAQIDAAGPDHTDQSGCTQVDAAPVEGGQSAAQSAAEEEDEGVRPIPDRLMTELTAYRTLALRTALADRPDIALLACVHALALQAFYPYFQDSCVEITARSAQFSAYVPGLDDSLAARSLGSLHQAWRAEMPRDPAQLWDVLVGWEPETVRSLLAYCVSRTVNALSEAYNRRARPLAHADRLAHAVQLDMVKAGWAPTEAFLVGLTKARIVQAVREACGDADAARIASYKKEALVEEGARLLAGSGWLPEPLRTRGIETLVGIQEGEAIAPSEPDAVQGAPVELSVDPDETWPSEPEFVGHAYAAE